MKRVPRNLTPAGAAPRRGVILLSVLVILVIAALVGTTVMYAAEAEGGGTRSSLGRVQARALAWSGVQAVLAELSSQRDDLLVGATPRVTEEWDLFTDDLGRRGVVRLMPRADDEAGDMALQGELARLDINASTAEMLKKSGLVDDDLASRIVAAKPFESVEDLLRVEGVTPELLFGWTAGAQDATPAGAGAAGDLGAGAGIALADVLTVFSFDPNIQSGVTDDGAPHRGKLRVNLNAPWSDELADAIADRFGPDAVQGVKNVFESGATFKTDADVVKKLRELNVPPEAWLVFLDAFTTTPDPFVIGRVDLNSAPARVLACVPGIDADAAAAIVAARSGLDDTRRVSVAWPVIEGILEPEKFQEAVPHVTTRSMVWRVRLECGLIADGADGDTFSDAPPPLRDRMVVDAILDVSSLRPRVAYLRDVTLLPVAQTMYERLAAGEGDAGDEQADQGDAPEDAHEPEAVETPPEETPEEPAGGRPPTGPPDNRTPEDRPEQPPSADTETSETGRAGGAPAPNGATPGRDRRIGRWTAGGGR